MFGMANTYAKGSPWQDDLGSRNYAVPERGSMVTGQQGMGNFEIKREKGKNEKATGEIEALLKQ